MSGPEYIVPNESRSSETGKARRVGYEIEFTGLDLTEVADLVAQSCGGVVEQETEVECSIDSPLGEFKVELDWSFGKKLAREQEEAQKDAQPEDVAVTDELDERLVEWLNNVAAHIVPVEIVCPPISLDDLSQLDPLIDSLRNAGARGTEASPFYAFGVHINPELPNFEAITIHRYILAFCICQDWLVKINQVDLTRRITPHIALYADEFILALIDEQHPTLAELIDTYLEYNPTRNRALDMTPLFRYLDEARVIARLDDDRIKARPTFHYRLPNSTPEAPDWYLSESWKAWCVGGSPRRISIKEETPTEGLDGLVVSGGDDIHPTLYGKDPDPGAFYDVDRDNLEQQYISEALKQELPILGICRGHQLINVVLGGSLLMDIRGLRQQTLNRRGLLATKNVNVFDGAALASLMQRKNIRVNSLHFQAIDRLGAELKAVAWDRDEIIQAFEAPQKAILGVQWHPEYLFYLPLQRRIFSWLVSRAREKMLAKVDADD